MRLLLITVLFLGLSSAAFSLDIKTNAPQIKETQVSENKEMTFYSIQEDKVQYYVTKPNHPAYPYMIKNNVVGNGRDTRDQCSKSKTDQR